MEVRATAELSSDALTVHLKVREEELTLAEPEQTGTEAKAERDKTFLDTAVT